MCVGDALTFGEIVSYVKMATFHAVSCVVQIQKKKFNFFK